MKPVAFDLIQPASLQEALTALQAPDARPIAGGQSLGAMLNLRLSRPARLVAIGHLPDLNGASEDAESITIGAAVTHAAIADGRTPDLLDGILARIAEGIAYRAVRNRGTIGGSLCHADPAADWPTTLTALGAWALIAGPNGTRALHLPAFLTGAFRVALAADEVLTAIRIPKPTASARFAYEKACRKPGEFAHAMAAILLDGATRRGVIGATGGPPILLADATEAAADAALAASGLDTIARHMQMVTFRRTLQRAEAGA